MKKYILEKTWQANKVKLYITAKTALSKEELKEIAEHNESIYFNDSNGKYWAFDWKLSSGKWVENLTTTKKQNFTCKIFT